MANVADRRVVVDAASVNVALDPYLLLRALASYSSLSVRTLRSYLGDPVRPLPHFRLGGRVLIRASEFDAWLSAYREATASVDVRGIVDSMLGPPRRKK